MKYFSSYFWILETIGWRRRHPHTEQLYVFKWIAERIRGKGFMKRRKRWRRRRWILRVVWLKFEQRALPFEPFEAIAFRWNDRSPAKRGKNQKTLSCRLAKNPMDHGERSRREGFSVFSHGYLTWSFAYFPINSSLKFVWLRLRVCLILKIYFSNRIFKKKLLEWFTV